jgi:hypothetical protein
LIAAEMGDGAGGRARQGLIDDLRLSAQALSQALA